MLNECTVHFIEKWAVDMQSAATADIYSFILNDN